MLSRSPKAHDDAHSIKITFSKLFSRHGGPPGTICCLVGGLLNKQPFIGTANGDARSGNSPTATPVFLNSPPSTAIMTPRAQGDWLIVGTEAGTVVVFKCLWETLELIRTSSEHVSHLSHMLRLSLSATGEALLVTTFDGACTQLAFDTTTGRLSRTLVGLNNLAFKEGVAVSAWAPCLADRVFIGTCDGTVHGYEVQVGGGSALQQQKLLRASKLTLGFKHVAAMPCPSISTNLPRTLRFSPTDPTALAVGYQNGMLALFNPLRSAVAAATTLSSLPSIEKPTPTTVEAHDGPVLSIAFSPCGRLLATGGTDARVRIWSVGATGDLALFGKLVIHDARTVTDLLFVSEDASVASLPTSLVVSTDDGSIIHLSLQAGPSLSVDAGETCNAVEEGCLSAFATPVHSKVVGAY